jgi:hypothetical protein
LRRVSINLHRSIFALGIGANIREQKQSSGNIICSDTAYLRFIFDEISFIQRYMVIQMRIQKLFMGNEIGVVDLRAVRSGA